MRKETLTSAKKKCWKAFSEYIRKRDCLATTGCIDWGLCVTCSKRYHIKLLQAGHFVGGRHNGNLFSEEGTHAQCYNCNINLRGNTLNYRRKIIEMYGEEYDETLEAEARKVIQRKIYDYEEMREDYLDKIKFMRIEQCRKNLLPIKNAAMANATITNVGNVNINGETPGKSVSTSKAI